MEGAVGQAQHTEREVAKESASRSASVSTQCCEGDVEHVRAPLDQVEAFQAVAEEVRFGTGGTTSNPGMMAQKRGSGGAGAGVGESPAKEANSVWRRGFASMGADGACTAAQRSRPVRRSAGMGQIRGVLDGKGDE